MRDIVISNYSEDYGVKVDLQQSERDAALCEELNKVGMLKDGPDFFVYMRGGRVWAEMRVRDSLTANALIGNELYKRAREHVGKMVDESWRFHRMVKAAEGLEA